VERAKARGYSVQGACKMIGLSPSSYYYSPKKSREEREKERAEIRGFIEEIQKEFPKAGYRSVQRYLLRDGKKIGERRLRSVMGEYGLWAEVKRAFVKTTDSNHNYALYPNLISGMTVTGVNQVWAADITYIRIQNGFVYLAVILDLFSRKVIGWAISKRIDETLTLNALRMALRRRRPPKGVIHHSDRGVQYVSKRYVKLLKRLGFHLSNSSKGNPNDNAFVESFMKTLKQNEVYLANYQTYLDVVENLPDFLEEVYNKKRVHSGIDYLTPDELELKIQQQPEMASRFELTL
jgi:putative transposase